MNTPTPQAPRTTAGSSGKRAVAVVLWGLIAVSGLWSGLSGRGLGGIVVGLLAGAYTAYLLRGGSIVVVLLPVWIWLPLSAISGARKLAGRGQAGQPSNTFTTAPAEEGIPSSPPHGWYPDPYPGQPEGQTRLWDGASWTSHVQPDTTRR